MTDRIRFKTPGWEGGEEEMATGPGRVYDRRGYGEADDMDLGDHLGNIATGAVSAIGDMFTTPPSPTAGSQLAGLVDSAEQTHFSPMTTAMTRAKALNIFTMAVKRAESNNPDGDYGAVRGAIRGGRLLGAYAIASDDWPHLANAAGIPGARWQDARAQDWVARATFDRLHKKYGDWRFVASAWKAGEAKTDAIYGAPALIEHDQLKPLRGWVEGVMKNAQESVTLGQTPEGVPRETFESDWTILTDTRVNMGQGFIGGGDMSGVPTGGGVPADDRGGDPVEAVLRRRLYALRERARNTPAPEEEGGGSDEDVRRGRGQGVAVGTRVPPSQATITRPTMGAATPSEKRGIFKNRRRASTPTTGGVQEF